MSDANYMYMIDQLRLKTESGKAIWKKLSRANEFAITFNTGTLVIDKWRDSEYRHEFFDFAIYNVNGDAIFNSGPLDESDLMHDAIARLHEIVTRRFYLVDETIQGFTEELSGGDTIGDKPSQNKLPTDNDDFPF